MAGVHEPRELKACEQNGKEQTAADGKLYRKRASRLR
jgi:hypothetical protein